MISSCTQYYLETNHQSLSWNFWSTQKLLLIGTVSNLATFIFARPPLKKVENWKSVVISTFLLWTTAECDWRGLIWQGRALSGSHLTIIIIIVTTTTYVHHCIVTYWKSFIMDWIGLDWLAGTGVATTLRIVHRPKPFLSKPPQSWSGRLFL